MQINCSDLGVADCTYTAYGETPGEAVEKIVQHLRREHNINMPDADQILESPGEGRANLDAVVDRDGTVVLGGEQKLRDEGVNVVTRRLIEILHRAQEPR